MSDNEEDLEAGQLEMEEEVEMDTVRKLQTELSKLSEKHDQAMAQISTLSNASNRSFVYVPRERPIQPFSGDVVVDGRSVDEFIDEVERAIRARGLCRIEQVDFIFSINVHYYPISRPMNRKTNRKALVFLSTLIINFILSTFLSTFLRLKGL